jgi:two-component system, cell cycle sensor histidine kinase and response regulator CckA
MTDPLPAAQPSPPSLALRYLVAVVAPVVVVAVTMVVQQSIAPTAAPIFSLAIAVAALYGGWGPGVVASILSIVGYLFFPGLLTGPAGVTRLVQFLVVATGITALGGFVYRQRWLAVAQAGENARLRRTAEEAASEAQEAMAVAEEETLKAEQFASDASQAAHEAQVALDARLEAETRLHAGTARLAAIVDSSNDAIIGKTLEGVITSWNRAAERIFGYPAAEMVGGSIFTLIPEEHQAAERDVLERLSRGEAVQNAEAERVRKDGRRIWISLSVSPLRDPTGRIVGAASIKRDVTDEKLAAARLRETQRLRVAGQLAGGIAHEANNQMLVVLGAADFILKRADLPSDIRQDLAAIRQAAERTAAITQQLLAYSRRQPVSIKNVDVDAVIRDMQPVIRRSLQEQHELSLRLELGETWVRLDGRQLEQVLLNLTLNARDAMPDGGRLTVRTFRAPPSALSEALPHVDGAGYACIAVEDTGTGMEPVTLERAFEPFFTTKGVGQGTGLGLSVVDGLIHQMGGTIRVASVVGKGSTFTIYLPLVATVLVAAGPSDAGAVAAGDGRVVLVVEDEANVRTIAARTLRDAGYAVHEARHGGEALDLVRGGTLDRLDLVVTDLGMPVMRGETLAAHLRNERPDVPVLYISGYTDTVAVEPFLQKPFAPDQLLREVGNLLRARAEADLRPPSAGVA